MRREKSGLPDPEKVAERWTQQEAGFASHVRTRALGTKVTRRPLVFRKKKKSRVLGSFLRTITKEEKIQQSRPWRKPKQKNISGNQKCQNVAKASASNTESLLKRSSEEESIHQDQKRISTSSSSFQPRASTSYNPGFARSKSSYENILIEMWNLLEVPMTQKMAFLVKYSTPTLAPTLGEFVKRFKTATSLILAREDLLDIMRKIQDKPEKNIDFDDTLSAKTKNVLLQHDCFISSIELFGLPTFMRVAHIVAKVSECCNRFLQDLQRDFDEKVTFRGGDYLQILAHSKHYIDAWSLDGKGKVDWRSVPVPPPCLYQTNMTLRRLGARVAT
eukprot:g1990.t1